MNLDTIFKPKSIAFIGASNNYMKWGFIVLANLIQGGYKGRIFPVNPKEKKILNLDVYSDVLSIPEPVDVVIITTPAETVTKIISDCVKKGIPSAIVISAGFSETGETGKKLEKEMVDTAASGNIKIVGPNTMGVVGTSVNLSAIMAPVQPTSGTVSFVSQSGNVGTQLLALGESRGIGFSKFVSSGNEGDLKCEDYIEYFGEDTETNVILTYVEGLDNGRKFLDIARKVSRKKPIVIFKGGQTNAGATAAASHTGVLAGKQEIYESAFKQAGIIKAASTDELLDLALGFSKLPMPVGKRVGIITWGGGWGVVTADACEKMGLDVVKLPEWAISELDKILPPYWSRGNPIDLVGTTDRRPHFQALEILTRCENVDGIIALGIVGASSAFAALGERFKTSRAFEIPAEFVDGMIKMVERVDAKFAKKINELIREFGKPIIGASIAPQESKLKYEGEEIIIYPTPEKAATVLAKLYEYRNILDKS